ncbi:MAG: DUF4474 domain-containing protein [Clostridia bacterium]|nr:DUF4474 domain-containing protein [Clostridia bacterium]
MFDLKLYENIVRSFVVNSVAGIDFKFWGFVLVLCVLAAIIVIMPETYYISRILGFLRTLGKTLSGMKKGEKTGYEAFEEIIDAADLLYDAKQDIFYYKTDAWQRNMGYCRLYDEAAAPLGMIVDCEPICFEYGGKRWLIEFWKGQYDLVTGCEIGIYTTDEPDLKISDIFEGTFYHCAKDEDMLFMSCSLKKKGKVLFRRQGKSWWLTGFKLGEFSEPSDLTVDFIITLKDAQMKNAFIQGLMDAGYQKGEFFAAGNRVALTFAQTHTPQPVTRTKETDKIIQKKNELLCKMYKEATKGYDNLPDKLNAIEKEAPYLYDKLLNMGIPRQLFDSYVKIKDHVK